MRCLIRTILRRGKSGSGHQDHWAEAAAITLGRGTDQHIHIGDARVALHHAQLTRAGGRRFRLTASAQGLLRVNGQLTDSALVTVGDTLEIGDTLITLIDPPADADLAVTVARQDSEAQARAVSSLFTSGQILAGRYLNKRRWAWGWFFSVLALFLILPLAGFYLPALQDLLRQTPLPSDHAWDSGTLASAHSYFGENCNACHEQAFTPVDDATCAQCHANIQHHVLPDERQIPGTRAEHCTHCHREHNGSRALALDDSRVCTGCHGTNGAALESAPGLLAASDFTYAHPQFRVSLSRIAADQRVSTERISLDRPGLVENSQLAFPHDVHLDPQGVDSPDGDVVLHCDDCHHTDVAGGLMQPIDMESHCLRCHELRLDPNYPQREVPHGKPEEILYILSEYFSRLAIEGAYWRGDQPAVQFSDTTQARAWAYDQARLAGQRLFEDRACGVCHHVTREQNADGLSWRILPARITHPWFPHARFHHQAHQAMACGDCHAAATSASSDDVLMPGIETCRQCHRGTAQEGVLFSHPADRGMVSPCTTCHVFHTGPLPQTRDAGAIATGLLRSRPAGGDAAQQPHPPPTPRRKPGQERPGQ